MIERASSHLEIALVFLGLAIGGCSVGVRTNQQPTAESVVYLAIVGTDEAAAPDWLADRAKPIVQNHVILPASGLSGALSLSTTASMSTPLAPDPKNAPPPAGWQRRWLRWPSELARTPEQLRWRPGLLDDPPAPGTIHLAIFDADVFETSGEAWFDALPARLKPPLTPWVVVHLGARIDSRQLFVAGASGRDSATIWWIGPAREPGLRDGPIRASEVASSIPRIAGRGTAHPAREDSADREPVGASEEFDLYVYVQGGVEPEFVEVELRVPGGILDRRAVDFEDIDEFLENGPAIHELRVAVGSNGDGAVFRLRESGPRLWLDAPGTFHAAGVLGVPFYAGPTGRSLGLRTLTLSPAVLDFYRILSPEAPNWSRETELAPGVHLWLVPRNSPRGLDRAN